MQRECLCISSDEYRKFTIVTTNTQKVRPQSMPVFKKSLKAGMDRIDIDI